MNRIEKSNTTSKPTAATPPHGLKIKAAVTPHAGQDRVLDLWRHIKRVDDAHHELDQQSVAAYQKDERKHKLLAERRRVSCLLTSAESSNEPCLFKFIARGIEKELDNLRAEIRKALNLPAEEIDE